MRRPRATAFTIAALLMVAIATMPNATSADFIGSIAHIGGIASARVNVGGQTDMLSCFPLGSERGSGASAGMQHAGMTQHC